MVTKDNALKVVYQPTLMGITAKNMMVARGNQFKQGQTVMDL